TSSVVLLGFGEVQTSNYYFHMLCPFIGNAVEDADVLVTGPTVEGDEVSGFTESMDTVGEMIHTSTSESYEADVFLHLIVESVHTSTFPL
ncbi:hypothetical protein, partial [Staphylococcus aureus]